MQNSWRGKTKMIKFRLYYDKDAEVEWFMKMVEQGWALKKYFLGFYKFEPCEPGEYIYQEDLLEYWTKNHDDYKDFMEENNIEIVLQWFRWIILRRKAQDGPFELYTDNASMIEQYQRIMRMFRGGLIIEIICLFMEFMAAVETQKVTFVIFTILLALIVACFTKMVWKCKWKIEELKRK